MKRYRLVFRKEARDELREAARWYERERKGLGAEMVAEVESVLKAIASSPLHFPVVYRNVRRAMVSRFPYLVFFRIREKDIEVLAIHHGSRNPRHWRART